MFYTWGHLDAPIHSYAPICLYASIHSYASWGFRHVPYVPILFGASVCFERHLHVVGIVGDPFHVGHLPYMLDTSPHMVDAPHISYPPLIGWIPCASVCIWEYLHVIWGILPLCWGLGGIPPYVGVWQGISISVKLWCLAVCPLGVHYALSCTFLVAHYDLHIYQSYD